VSSIKIAGDLGVNRLAMHFDRGTASNRRKAVDRSGGKRTLETGKSQKANLSTGLCLQNKRRAEIVEEALSPKRGN